MIYKSILKSHKKNGKDKGKYLSLCCMSINFYWSDIKGYDCTHRIPIMQICDMYRVIGKKFYPFLNKIISHGSFIVLLGLNKNHGLTQDWMEIGFFNKKKTKKELDDLLYQWGHLKRDNEKLLTKRYQNKIYITKEKKEERAKKSGLVYDENGKLIDFNPFLNDLDIIAMNTDDEEQIKMSVKEKKIPESIESLKKGDEFLQQFIKK